jgi:hypothetical protein
MNPTPVVPRSCGASPSTLSEEELAALRQRLTQGFYERPEITALIAAAVLPEVERRHGD